MIDLQLELATPKHLDDLYKIIKTSFNEPQSRYLAIGQPGYKHYLRDLLPKNGSGPQLLFAGTIDGEIGGFVDVTIGQTGPNFLTRIAVKSNYRGYGVSKLMLSLIQQNYSTERRWELDVFQSNIGAKRLYESLGFEVLATKKWLGRMLPRTQRTDSSSDFESPQYRLYGFTTTVIRGHHFSVAGSAVRCRDLETFSNNTLLSQAQEQFPRVDRAFIVLDDSVEDLSAVEDTFEIGRSHRMSGSL